MTRLIMTRGLPASGKTTRARAWVAEDETTRARVNKDDLRMAIHAGVYRARDTERQVNAARDAAIAALLKLGVDVVNDDTNLPQRVARDIARIGRLHGADVEVWDMTDVPVETCLERDRARGSLVGEESIRRMWLKYVKGQRWPLPAPDDPADEQSAVPVPYVARPYTMKAIMVDLDGTCALFNGRDPFDETKVHTDMPNRPVVAAVKAMFASGHSVIFCSGRTEGCREATTAWLCDHFSHDFVSRTRLLMRPVGDTRKDSVVKLELFDREIRNHYTVVAVFDDRQQVVDAWRSIGLTVFQVAPGNF